jgi:hypothetical protein
VRAVEVGVKALESASGPFSEARAAPSRQSARPRTWRAKPWMPSRQLARSLLAIDSALIAERQRDEP